MTDEPSDSDDLFREQMQGVKPLRQHRVQGPKGAGRPDLAQQAAREAAVSELGPDENHLGDGFIPPVKPDDLLAWNKSGIQHGVLRKLRLGQYDIESRLDLHKHTVEQARAAVFRFVRESLQYDVRTALIIHGKGKAKGSDGSEGAVIKSCVNHWLKELPDVQAFHTAQRHHGGYGAVYVLLRKSSEAKQKTRERLSRR